MMKSLDEITVVNKRPSIVWMPSRSIDERIDAYPNDAKFLDPLQTLLHSKCGRLESMDQLTNHVRCGPFGSNLLAEKYLDKGVCVLRPFNISSYSVSSDNLVFISEEECERNGLKYYDTGTLVFSRVGNIAVGCIPEREYRFTISPNIIAAGINNNLVNPFYVCSFLNTRFGFSQLERALKIVAQPTISTETVKRLLVPVPDQPIQDYIGVKVELAERCRAIAWDIDNKCQQQLLIATRETGDYAVLEAVKHRTYPSTTDFQTRPIGVDSFSVKISPKLIRERLDPEGYHPTLLSIREYAKMSKSLLKPLHSLVHLASPSRSRIVANDVRLFISILHLDDRGFIDLMAAQSHYPESNGINCVEGDVLVSCINPSANRIAAFGSKMKPAACSMEFTIIIPKDINPEYLAFALRSDICLQQLIHLGKGTSSSRRRVSEKELMECLVPVIPNSKDIGRLMARRKAFMFTAFRLIAEAKVDNEALIERKLDVNGILSGRMRPPKWEDIEKEIERETQL